MPSSKSARRRKREQPVTVAVLAVAVVAVVALVLYRTWGSSGSGVPRRYYSADDGQTFFADAASKQPPFDRGGKPAVLAVVYRPAAGGTPFVGYLQTFANGGPQVTAGAHLAGGDTGLRVKRPRDPSAPWVGPADPGFEAVCTVTAPGGGGVVQVEPE